MAAHHTSSEVGAGRPPRRRRSRGAGYVGAPLLLIVFLAWVRLGPLPDRFLDPVPHRSTLIVDRNGATIYESLSANEQRSHWIDANEIPPNVEIATLAAEDHRFFSHPGIDPVAIARALVHDAIAGRFVEGGSTITQQTVKQILIARGEASGPRGIRGKLREMLLALRLEHRLDKREILALYLNLAPYGNQYVGIERASTGYFGVPPTNLTHAQAAFLAGLPRKPSALDPWTNRPAAIARQQRVLRRMKDEGFIESEDLDEARGERLAFHRTTRETPAPHFVERILSEPGAATATRIETTLDLGLQREIMAILERHDESLDKHGAHNLAIAVLDNESGEWLAWVGSRDYFDADHGGAIDAVISPRQPGSALKPFTYALAFEAGFSPSSVLPDVEIDFPTAEKGIRYKPRNYDGVYRGPLRARLALAGSENVPAVWLLSRLGTPTLLSALRASSFTTLDRDPKHYGLGLTLGDAEVRLDELVTAYAMLARGGEPVRARAVHEMENEKWKMKNVTTVTPSGRGVGHARGLPSYVLSNAKEQERRSSSGVAPSRHETRNLGGPSARTPSTRSARSGSLGRDDEAPPSTSAGPVRTISPRSAFFVTDILADPRAREYVFGDGGPLDFPFEVAVKTGTSQAYRDNWTVGYTRELTVGVWVGNVDRTPLRNSSGITGAAPIFHDVMMAAVRRRLGTIPVGEWRPVAAPTAGIDRREICALSGDQPSAFCTVIEKEWVDTSAPRTICGWHTASGVQWPGEFRHWANATGASRTLAVTSNEITTSEETPPSAILAESRPIRIVNPGADSLYWIDPTLRAEFQTLGLRAIVDGRSPITWYIDDDEIGTRHPDEPLDWPLQRGAHRITAQDASGHRDTVRITVR